MESDPTENAEIRLLRAGGEARSEPLIAPRAGDGVYHLRFSPDGRWVAFNTLRGRAQVFVAPVSNSGVWRQVSTEGGAAPTWSRDQTELYFRRGNQIRAVPIKTTPSLDFGKDRVLFEARYARDPRHPSYDVGPNGRFLMIRPSAEELAPPSVHLVLNWFEELKRRVPVN